jgi:membrane protease YdiL (CAAX protease family)
VIGPLLLALSWVLLRVERKPLSVLGFDRPRRRALEFGAGLLVAGGFVALQQLLGGLAAGHGWARNPAFGLASALESLRFNVNSVLFEELTFRGYLLYQAIRRLGPTRACVLSAAAFGVYHWFSYEVLGEPVTMAYVFLLTGAAGLMFARAFQRTGSLALPIGLHLGWNLVTILVFSNGPIGDQLLVPSPADRAGVQETGPALLIGLGLPLCFTALVLFGLRRLPGTPARELARDAGSPG